MAYLSFFGQLHRNSQGLMDPAPVSPGWVAAIKGLGLMIGVTALVLSLWPIRDSLPSREQ
jgi:hypothetical protein